MCPIRKYFITYIDKELIEPGEYLCHLIVDNNIKIDKRYKYINKNNIIYNLITFDNYHIKKKKPKQIEIEIEKKNKEIKKKKDIDKKINEELDNFYIYYYNNDNDNDNEIYNENNNNDNSFNSNSVKDITKNKKNIFNYRNQIDENDPDQVIEISNELYKSNKNTFFLKSNYKYIKKNNKKSDGNNINDNNIINTAMNKNEIDIDEYIKEKNNDNKNKIEFQRLNSLDSKSDKDSIHQSERLNYNNILEELSQSVSSIVSNISMKNINSYSKKTHKTKFKNSNHKNISKGKSTHGKSKNKKNKSVQKKYSKIPNSINKFT